MVPGETAVNLMSPQEQDKQGHKLISTLDFACFYWRPVSKRLKKTINKTRTVNRDLYLSLRPI